MPTDKEPVTFHVTEWELSDWRDLLAQLQELRLVPLKLTLPKLTLRLVRAEAEQLRQLIAEGQIAKAAAMLGTSNYAPSAERTEQGTMPRQPVSKPTSATARNPSDREAETTSEKVQRLLAESQAQINKLKSGAALSPEPEPEPKRGPGRPATGKTTDTRTVTLRLEDWAWVDAQGGSRSHVLASLIAKARLAIK